MNDVGRGSDNYDSEIRGAVIPTSNESALVVFQAGLGDALLSLPALRLLMERFPRCMIDVVVNQRVLPLLPLLDIPLRRIHRLEYGGGWRGDILYLQKAVTIRATGPTYGILPYASSAIRTALLLRGAGCRRRVGHQYPVRWFGRSGWNLTDALDVVSGRHFCKLNIDLIATLTGASPQSVQMLPARYQIEVDIQSTAWVLEYLHTRNIPTDRPIIVLHPGGGGDMKQKRWPAERFARVAQSVCNRHQVFAIVVAGGAELAEASLIVNMLQGRGILAVNWELRHVAALLKYSSVLLCNDTGIMHLGAAVGTSVVALFGPTDPAESGPLGSHTIIRSNVQCAPCHSREQPTAQCLHQHRCMTSISIEDVVTAIDQALQEVI
jgi:heptosyltransferase-1